MPLLTGNEDGPANARLSAMYGSPSKKSRRNLARRRYSSALQHTGRQSVDQCCLVGWELISAPLPWVAVRHLGDAEAEAAQALDSGLFDPLGLLVVMFGFLGCCILCRSRERGRPSACGMSASSSSGLAAESRVSGYHLNRAKDDVRSRPKVPRSLDVW